MNSQYVEILPEKCVILSDFPDYAVSEDGSVWTKKKKGVPSPRSVPQKWRKMSPHKDKDGYSRVVMSAGHGKTLAIRTHHLVLQTFIGPRQPGMECRHLNGIRDDNRKENLAWGTHKENCQDKKLHGTHQEMQSHPMAKLKEMDVRAIRSLSKHGFTFKYISEVFNVSKSNIRSIVSRSTWSKVS